MARATVVFPHIPKCAGTSIKAQIDAAGLNVLYDYAKRPGADERHERLVRQGNLEARSRDISGYDVVYGHFPVDRYDRPGCVYVTLLRDPFERAFSQYRYLVHRYRQTPERLRPRAFELARDIERGDAGLPDFIVRTGSDRAYRMYLRGWPPGRFELIGDCARYGEFVGRLQQVLGIPLRADIRSRTLDVEICLPPDQERAARALLREDTAVYQHLTGTISRSVAGSTGQRPPAGAVSRLGENLVGALGLEPRTR